MMKETASVAESVAQNVADSIAERRPLKVREVPLFSTAARALVARGVTPNMVSFAGLLAGIASGLALFGTSWVDPGVTQRLLWVLGAVLIQLRGVGNLLDGVMAVETGSSTPVGYLWNEVPDRVSDAATMVGAGYALGGDPILGWGAALMAMFVAYVRSQVKIAGAPQDYCGPMAKPMRMVLVAVGAVYLAFTPASWGLAWGPGGAWGVMAAALIAIIIGGAVTAMRRLVRGARTLREGDR